jgi:transcriptional regulator with XRE-family HTH domain
MDESGAAGELRDWLRQLKAASGASYADIARAIGEEERTVKRWMPEKGDPVVPRGDALLRLLDYFGVEVSPPAPRAMALSLMGELREVRETLARLEGREDGDDELSLRRLDHRLSEVVDLVVEALDLLRAQPVSRKQATAAARVGPRKRASR